MNERMLHDLVGRVRDGRLARRDFIARMVALGVCSTPVPRMVHLFL